MSYFLENKDCGLSFLTKVERNWVQAIQQVDVAELKQKLQSLESLKKELELLQRQKAASEQALNEKRRQSSGGVWGWIAGTPPDQQDDAWCNNFDDSKPDFYLTLSPRKKVFNW